MSRLLPSESRLRYRRKSSLSGAQKIADFFLDRGGIFLKVAQYLSTVSNLFDLSFSEIFASIPDRTVPRPYKEIRSRFYNEFKVEPEEVFLEFNREAIASASLGQVHTARLHDNRKVAVKLLHPNVESQVRQDLKALLYAVNLIRFIYPHINFRDHLNEFSNMIIREMDYRNEAENMHRCHDNWNGEKRIIIPKVIDEFSRSTVLTTEYIDGISIANIKELDKAGVDKREVINLLVFSYVQMIFKHRFFHADPHPGNIFVLAAKGNQPVRIALVDFGATQDLTDRVIEQIKSFISIARSRDILAFVSLAKKIGLLHNNADFEKYTNLFELIYIRYGSFKIRDYYRVNPIRFGRVIKLNDLTGVELRLRDIIMDLHIPRRFIYIGRTISLLLSICHNLNDSLNIFILAKPYIDKQLRDPAYFLQIIRRRLWQLIEGRANFTQQITNNPFDWEKQLNADRKAKAVAQYQLGQQLLFAILGLSGTIITIYLHQNNIQEYLFYSIYGTAVSFALLLYRSLSSPNLHK